MTDTADQFDPPADDQGTPEEAAEPPADEQTDDNPNKREARYRLQLREAEAERDQLRANVEALQRAEVERIAGRVVQKPAGLWAADVELTALLDDNGNVDPEKVTAAAQSARDDLGLAPTRPAGYVASEGRVVGQPPAGNAWQDAFKG